MGCAIFFVSIEYWGDEQEVYGFEEGGDQLKGDKHPMLLVFLHSCLSSAVSASFYVVVEPDLCCCTTATECQLYLVRYRRRCLLAGRETCLFRRRL